MQNLVLALGAIVAVGAIGLIPYFYNGLGSQARWTSLTVLTARRRRRCRWCSAVEV